MICFFKNRGHLPRTPTSLFPSFKRAAKRGRFREEILHGLASTATAATDARCFARTLSMTALGGIECSEDLRHQKTVIRIAFRGFFKAGKERGGGSGEVPPVFT